MDESHAPSAFGSSEAQTLAEAGNGLPSNRLREGREGRDKREGRDVRDPEEVLAVWRALHDGRWSILEERQHGGRHALVVRVGDAPVERVLRERIDASLSLRERQVVALAVLGHTNKHIAHVLSIATSTAATHLRHAIDKLGARSRAELARRLLSPPSTPACETR